MRFRRASQKGISMRLVLLALALLTASISSSALAGARQEAKVLMPSIRLLSRFGRIGAFPTQS